MRGPTRSCLAGLVAFGTGLVLAGSLHAQDRGTAEEQQACEPDVWRLCVAAIPDEQAIVSCLGAHARDLSPGCRRVIAPAREVRTR